jgi:DNA transposition AAA+ family ATPase
MEKKLKPGFVNTRNNSRFLDALDRMREDDGEGRLACIVGKAGRGKTEATRHFHADHADCIYLRALKVWSTLDLLRDLCLELGIAPPFRRTDAFRVAVRALRATPRTIFIDEIEKLPTEFLEVIRDLADEARVAIILIGEKAIPHRSAGLLERMRSAERVWSRTKEVVEFQDVDAADIITLARECAGAGLSAEVAEVFRAAADGDFRVAKRDLGTALRLAAAKKSDHLTAEIARAACRAGLRG